VDDKRANLPAGINPEKIIDQTDARLIARLTQLARKSWKIAFSASHPGSERLPPAL